MIDGLALAQAAYDRAELPEPETCRFCDGSGTVTVVEIADCQGRVYGFKWDTENPGTPCPVCKLELVVNGERLE